MKRKETDEGKRKSKQRRNEGVNEEGMHEEMKQ